MASKTLGKHLEFSEYLSLQKLIYIHFVPTLLLYELVLSTAADITGRAHQTTQVTTLALLLSTNSQTATQNIARQSVMLSAVHKP